MYGYVQNISKARISALISLEMDAFEWNVFNEGQLLGAMVGHKPVGVNKYFQMAFILDKFTENIQRDVESDKIWAHLETMYNLEAVDESESLPFPNDEKDFYLPESEYGALKSKKDEKADDKKHQQQSQQSSQLQQKGTSAGGRETPKNLKELKKEELKQTPNRISKDTQRRDSKEGKDSYSKLAVATTASAKKEIRKDEVKNKPIKSRSSIHASKDESGRTPKSKSDDIPRAAKRPTRGSLKPEDGNSSGKASPVTVTPMGNKRRRV